MKRLVPIGLGLLLFSWILVATPPAPADTKTPDPKMAAPPAPGGSSPLLDLDRLLAKTDQPVDLFEVLTKLSLEGAAEIPRQKIRQEIDQLVAALRSVQTKNPSTIELIVEWTFQLFVERSFQYDPKGTVLLGPLFQTGRAGPAGLASLLIVVARQSNLPVSAGLAGDHLLCRYADGERQLNIELSEMGDVLPDRYYVHRHGAAPRNLHDREFLGYILYHTAMDIFRPRGLVQRAAQALAGAASLFPDYSPIQAELGRLALETGDEATALEHFERAIGAGSNNVDLHMQRARLIRNPAAIRTALADYNRILTLQPSNLTAVLGKASLLDRLQRPQEALDLLDQSLRSLPAGADRERLALWRNQFQQKSDLEIIQNSEDFSLRVAAIDRLRTRGEISSIPILLELLDRPNYRIRWAAAHAIRQIADLKPREFERLGLDSGRWNQWWNHKKKSP